LIRFRARSVLPISTPPIDDGWIAIENGRISATGGGPVADGVPEVDLGSVALLPGLVNAHTHLELTGFDDRVDDPEFAAWIRHLIALKRERTPADMLAAARQGVRDCWAAGVTTVADTGDSGAVIQALAELGASGIAYHEVFGPHPESAEEQFTAFRERLTELSAFTGPRVFLGVSPHAPYSVSGPLYTSVARLARDHHFPVAVHLAESPAEVMLLRDGSGEFGKAWALRGIPLPGGSGTPVEWLDRNGVLGPNTLCIHMVQATPGDLRIVRERGCAVAHCPRSNRRHGHGVAPLRDMLAQGLRVGVGTDSVASTSPLDLLAEARLARQIGGLTCVQALELCTIGAARAIGLEREVGSIASGKWADFAVLSIPPCTDGHAALEAVLASESSAIVATYLAARQVWLGTRLSVNLQPLAP